MAIRNTINNHEKETYEMAMARSRSVLSTNPTSIVARLLARTRSVASGHRMMAAASKLSSINNYIRGELTRAVVSRLQLTCCVGTVVDPTRLLVCARSIASGHSYVTKPNPHSSTSK